MKFLILLFLVNFNNMNLKTDLKISDNHFEKYNNL